MRARARGFTLIELLVCFALSLVLVIVVAGTFRVATSTQQVIVDRLDGRRSIHAAADAIERDVAAAISVYGAARFFQLTCRESADGEHTDDLELLVLARHAARLERVRYSVSADGTLWRQVFPVPAAELPLDLEHLASDRAAEEPLLFGLTRLQVRVPSPGAEAFEDPRGGQLTASDLSHTGKGRGDHRTLVFLTEPPPLLPAGTPVWLEQDTLDPPWFVPGAYAVSRQGEGKLRLAERLGDPGPVRWGVARLPSALQIDLRGASGQHERLLLPLPNHQRTLVELARRAAFMPPPPGAVSVPTPPGSP